MIWIFTLYISMFWHICREIIKCLWCLLIVVKNFLLFILEYVQYGFSKLRITILYIVIANYKQILFAWFNIWKIQWILNTIQFKLNFFKDLCSKFLSLKYCTFYFYVVIQWIHGFMEVLKKNIYISIFLFRIILWSM